MNCEPEIIKEMREREKQKLLHNPKEKLDNISKNNFFDDAKGLVEEKYRMITENTSDLISLITFEMKPKYTYLSPSHEKIMGYKPGELEGKIATELVHPDDVKKLLILLSKYVKTKTKKFFGLKGLPSSEKIEYRIKDKNGVWRYLAGTADLVGNKILIVSKDITEQKNAERQLQEAHKKLQDMNKSLEKKVAERTAKIEQLLKQKDEFIGQLGHDLKNPLNPLINLIPVLEKEENNEKHKEILEVINRNVHYMRNLVIKTIELAKLNSPNIKFSMEKLNLMTEFDKIVKKIRCYLVIKKSLFTTIFQDILK